MRGRRLRPAPHLDAFAVIRAQHGQPKASHRTVSAPAPPARTEVRSGPAISEGTKGHDPWSEPDVRPEDGMVRKYRFSAFLPGTRDLP